MSFFLKILRFFDSEKKGCLFLFILSLGLRLPGALFPPSAWVYNVDEFSFLKSTLGMTFGLVPTELQWPAATLHFSFLPVVWVHFLISSSVLGRSLWSLDFNGWVNTLLLYLGQSLYHPQFLLITGRILIGVVCAATPLWIVFTLKDHLGKMEKWTIGLLFAVSPLLIGETAVLKGDALALMFWGVSFYGFLRFLTSPRDLRDRMLFRAFLFLGLAVASRFTYGIVLPFFLAIVWMKLSLESPPGKVPLLKIFQRLFFLTAIFLIPLFIFFPFIWTHPLSTLKATVGNYLFLTYGAGKVLARSMIFTSLINQVGLPALILAVFGGIMIWKQKGRWPGFMALLLFLIFFIPLWRAKHVEPRYTLPLLPILAYWACSGVKALSNLGTRRFSSGGTLFLAAIFLLMVGWNFWYVTQWFGNTHPPSPLGALTHWVRFNTRPGDHLGLPSILRPYIPPNHLALIKIIKNYESHPDSAIKRASQLQRKIEHGMAVSPALPDFALKVLSGEDEALDLFCYQAMLQAALVGKAPDLARDALYYLAGEPDKPDSFSEKEVTEMFQRGDLDALVTHGTNPDLASQGFQPSVSFIPWFVYLRHFPTRDRFLASGGILPDTLPDPHPGRPLQPGS
jgi:hypothetical protein